MSLRVVGTRLGSSAAHYFETHILIGLIPVMKRGRIQIFIKTPSPEVKSWIRACRVTKFSKFVRRRFFFLFGENVLNSGRGTTSRDSLSIFFF